MSTPAIFASVRGVVPLPGILLTKDDRRRLACSLNGDLLVSWVRGSDGFSIATALPQRRTTKSLVLKTRML